jgi:peptidyl-prolyl cis-trans isomerase D
MLGYLRNNADNLVMKLILGVLALVFIFFYGSTAGSPQNPVVAQVNGEPVRDIEVRNAWRNLVNQRQRSGQGNLSDEQRQALRRDAIDQLIDRKLLLQAAKDEKIEVSAREVRRAVIEAPDFQDEEGKFNKLAYTEWAKDRGRLRRTEQQLRESLAIDALYRIVRASAHVSDGELETAYVEESSKRNVEFVRVADSLFLDEVSLTDDEAKAWADANEDATRERYDRDFDRLFNQPKKVRARHILLKFDDTDDEATREAIRGRMAGILTEVKADGADFAELARKYSEDSTAPRGGDLDFFDERRMVKEFSDAAFNLPVGGLSDVVETQYGLHIIKVEEIQEPKTTSFDDAKAEIARDLAREEKAPVLAKAWAASLPDLLRGEDADALNARLAERKLTLQETGDFNRSARSVPKLGRSDEAAAAAFALAKVGDVSEPIQVSGAWVVMRLKAATEADMAAFAEKKTALRDRLLISKQARALDAWRRSLKEDAKIELSPGA